MVPEVYHVFWAGMAAGEFINDAAIAAAANANKAPAGWLRRAVSDLVLVDRALKIDRQVRSGV